MENDKNIARFEAELAKVKRPGMDKLLNYIRKSDFYTAPASTKYHMSCPGGLLQHSLNVLDALRGLLTKTENGYEYRVAGKTVQTYSEETVIITALLHDICKTYFYSVGSRNVKNEQTGKWEKVPTYNVKDKMPLGHGPKSAMLIMQYIKLDNNEMYAIWWHMGYSNTDDTVTLMNAVNNCPIIWLVHTADMQATTIMEGNDGNKEMFIAADPEPESAAEYGDAPPFDEYAPCFEDCTPC